jgi:hypothetical protein
MSKSMSFQRIALTAMAAVLVISISESAMAFGSRRLEVSPPPANTNTDSLGQAPETARESLLKTPTFPGTNWIKNNIFLNDDSASPSPSPSWSESDN